MAGKFYQKWLEKSNEAVQDQDWLWKLSAWLHFRSPGELGFEIITLGIAVVMLWTVLDVRWQDDFTALQFKPIILQAKQCYNQSNATAKLYYAPEVTCHRYNQYGIADYENLTNLLNPQPGAKP